MRDNSAYSNVKQSIGMRYFLIEKNIQHWNKSVISIWDFMSMLFVVANTFRITDPLWGESNPSGNQVVSFPGYQ